MKRTFIILTLLTILLAAFTSCGSSPLEKAVRHALVQQDTTQAQFNNLCDIIKQNPKKYAQYLTGDDVNVATLAQLVERIGGSMRPPIHWNLNAYAAQEPSLTIYFERSGSMVPYDTPGGQGILKKTVNDLINSFPGQKVSINIVNDDIYPYQGTIDAFLQDRNIYASTADTGNPAYTDFNQIFSAILRAQTAGNVSVVVTDLIYSPADTRNVSITKILNEENSLATRIFRNYKGKSVVVTQIMGDYNGKYYPYTGQPVNYSGMRPFYLLLIADTPCLDAMTRDARYQSFLHPARALHSYRFNQEEHEVDHCLVPGWANDAGRYRPSHKEADLLEKCEGDKETGILCFSLAADLSPVQQSEPFLADAANYNVRSLSNFTLQVTPITPQMITANNRQYLEGKTHLLTLTGKLQGVRDEVTIELRNDFPAWVAQTSADDDSNPLAPQFASTTLGLLQWMQGMQDAFGNAASYTTLRLKLVK